MTTVRATGAAGKGSEPPIAPLPSLLPPPPAAEGSRRTAANWWRRAAVIGAVAAVIPIVRLTLFRAAPVPVTVFVVAPGPVEETVTNSKAGTVKARHRANLSPEVGGRVAEVSVRKGEWVEAGTVLLRLDDTEHRARVTLAERAIIAATQQEKQACLSAELSVREHTRLARLAAEKILAEQELDRAANRRDVAHAECDAARARVHQLESELDVVRNTLEKTTLRAPFAGLVAELAAERGEWITPSPAGIGITLPSVVNLIDPGSIYVTAPLDEVDHGKVKVDQPVHITMDAYPGRPFSGRVTRVGSYIADAAQQSRTFEVEVAFDDADVARGLPVGASADIEVILRASEGVLRVPSYALVEGKQVLVLAGGCGLFGTDECLVARSVRVGLKNWEFAEASAGLAAGDRVVVSIDQVDVKAGVRAAQAAVTAK